ncbi:MAG TPA: carboxypeptidase-like regulatory domain-containing protein [Planctomycetaceae bacterium]|nr:carboxypeptidase-like regulatory domain-containing protein [Planctomycetaceae bacterium]
MFVRLRRNRFFHSCSLLCLVFAGCSGGAADRPDLYPVSGTVMYNGDPVEGATVSFISEKAPRAASGITNSEGKFQLSTFDVNDGAVAGTHTITVRKMEAGATPAMTKEEEAKMLNDPTAMANQMTQGGNTDSGPKSLLPEKYQSSDTSGLTEEVKADGENVFVLQLTD